MILLHLFPGILLGLGVGCLAYYAWSRSRMSRTMGMGVAGFLIFSLMLILFLETGFLPGELAKTALWYFHCYGVAVLLLVGYGCLRKWTSFSRAACVTGAAVMAGGVLVWVSGIVIGNTYNHGWEVLIYLCIWTAVATLGALAFLVLGFQWYRKKRNDNG